MNMKKVTVTDEDSHGHSLLRADWSSVAAKIQTIVFCEQTGFQPHCKETDYTPLSVFEQTGFQSHCKETDYTPPSFASRLDSSRIAKKRT